jgi:hypothetical protein
VDGEVVPVDLGPHAAGLEAASDGGQAVALLDAELGQAPHHGPAPGEGGGDREDRVLVDHRGRALGRDLDAAQLEPRSSRSATGSPPVSRGFVSVRPAPISARVV